MEPNVKILGGKTAFWMWTSADSADVSTLPTPDCLRVRASGKSSLTSPLDVFFLCSTEETGSRFHFFFLNETHFWVLVKIAAFIIDEKRMSEMCDCIVHIFTGRIK